MENDQDELLIVITPHVVSTPKNAPGQEIWITNNR
jgi:Flp pilus assembly secretin CpaC